MDINYNCLADEELVTYARKNNDAMEILINRFENQVEIISRKFFIVGGDSEDVFQEGLIGLSKAVYDYEESYAKFRTFANICIERHIIDAVKMANRNKHEVLSKALSYNNILQSDEQKHEFIEYIDKGSHIDNPEEVFLSKESIESIKSSLFKVLSSFEQKVLLLYLKGESYENIGKIVKKDTKSIDNAVQRIRKKLKNELKTLEA